MSGPPERDLIIYRLEQAHKALEEAGILRSAGQWLGTVNRAYYAMFYCIQALLAKGGFRTSKHIGAMSLFDREFVRTGLFDTRFSKWLHQLFELRHDADYSDLFVLNEGKAQEALERARAFVEKTDAFLKGALK